MQIALIREFDDATDTCTGSLVIVGLDATYQGLSTYLAFIEH
jgi:hypothetical protein